jgi:glucose-1-phosphate thymidylyltransferase
VKNQPFIVYLGDNLIKGGINIFVKRFGSSNDDAMVLLCRVKNPQGLGAAKN